MEPTLTKHNIEIKHHFEFLDKDNLEKFMRLDSKAHTHNYYILSFLYEGEIAHLTDFQDERVHAPAILMLDIDQVHTHPDTSGCKLVSIAFSTNFIAEQNQRFLEKVSKVFSRPFIALKNGDLDRLDEVIKIISWESEIGNKDDDILKALLNLLIVHCLKLSEAYPISPEISGQTYNRFRILLKENYNREHQVRFYAEMLNVTTRILTQSIKASTLKTPKQLIEQQLLLEAKRLLFWSDVSVKEIAWQLGFETDSYFNRFFKKHTGKTPKEFAVKKNLKGK